jgi:hypothetical protein
MTVVEEQDEVWKLTGPISKVARVLVALRIRWAAGPFLARAFQ